MDFSKRFVLINNIKLSVNASVSEAFSVARRTLSHAGLASFAQEYSVFRRSVDARKKPDIYYVYTIAARGDFPPISERVEKKYGISSHTPISEIEPEIGQDRLSAPPVIVGSGPCGLFAALLLAEWGYKPVILERGGSVADRHIAKAAFESSHVLNTETNIQFGAGGAGTFSDGKLVTRINDPLTAYILTILIALTGWDLTTAFSAIIGCITNTGPGVGNIVGPAGNYAPFSDSAKYICSFAMLLGRLEVLTILVIFTKNFWHK